MRLTTESFIEHQSMGQQEIGIMLFASVQLVVGGACTCCEGCSSCSCCAAINRDDVGLETDIAA